MRRGSLHARGMLQLHRPQAHLLMFVNFRGRYFLSTALDFRDISLSMSLFCHLQSPWTALAVLTAISLQTRDTQGRSEDMSLKYSFVATLTLYLILYFQRNIWIRLEILIFCDFHRLLHIATQCLLPCLLSCMHSNLTLQVRN